MKVLLFGAGGQVGREALACARPDVEVLRADRTAADLAVPGAAAHLIRKLKPDAVINAAAWTAVDRAESKADAVFRINADAAGEIAAASRIAGARFVHLSTDYVFAGDDPAPLAEDAPVGPLNVYGAAKLEGERLARSENPDAVVVRTSWIYSAHGANFVKTMLRLAEARSELDIVSDQIGGPTPASAIAAACLSIAAAKDGPSGVYHFQGAPAASWADFAEAIFKAARKSVKVNRIPSSAYSTPARRPHFTILDCSKILRDYGVAQPDWRADVERTVRALNDHSHHAEKAHL